VLVPLYVLAGLSMMAGYMGLPQFWGDMMLPPEVSSDSLGNFLASVVVTTPHSVPRANAWALVVLAVSASIGGFFLAWLAYVRLTKLAARFAKKTTSIVAFVRNSYYIDELYDFAVVRPLLFVSDRIVARFIEARVVDGTFVEGAGRAVRGIASELLRPMQSGLTQAYFFFMIAGVAAMLVYLVG
jgi:NADH-quinone oxidoreductase subunit L